MYRIASDRRRVESLTLWAATFGSLRIPFKEKNVSRIDKSENDSCKQRLGSPMTFTFIEDTQEKQNANDRLIWLKRIRLSDLS